MKFAVNIAFSFLLLFSFAVGYSEEKSRSIVPLRSQISDFSARLELAKVLSRHKETRSEAFKQFQILLKEKFPEDFLDEFSSQELEKDNPSIIPYHEWVTDFDAHHALARVYSHHRDTYEKALIEYQRLLESEPRNIELVIELAQLYVAMENECSALEHLYHYLALYPRNLKILKELAQVETRVSHIAEATELFNQALEISPNDKSIIEAYGNAMMASGSFYKAEQLFRELLIKDPDSLDFSLKLAWSLVSAQRYEEAEGLYYQLLVIWPCESKIILALARMKILEKDFCQALDFAEELLGVDSQNPIFLDLKAEILIAQMRYCDAVNFLHLFIDDSELGTKAFLDLGKTFLKIGNCEEAYASFEYALFLDPKNIDAQFYLAGLDVDQEDFLDCLIDSLTNTKDLIAWAKVFQSHLKPNQAIRLYRAALKIDPRHFSAKMDLAEALSSIYCYKKALCLYWQLLEEDPQNYKVMLSIARVKAWSKNYTTAIQHYDNLISLNPDNPVVYREKARTAIWGKKFAIAKQSYEALLCPPIDSIDINNWSTYLIQKSLRLELRAKQLAWNKRYFHSLEAYRELLEFNPGNEEALFDYAQNYCVFGLCDCSRSVYHHFLNIAPYHDLARRALRRNEIREHRAVQGYVSYWREVGSGTFSQSQIARYRADIIFEQPITCRGNLRFRQHAYVENPFFNFKFYPAEGQTLEGDYIFNENIKWFGGISYKTYFHAFKSVYTAMNNLYLKINDLVSVTLGCNRENEIYDYFSLKQATQSINSWMTISSNLTRYWSLAGTYQYYRYNDHNSQVHYNITTEYQLTESPKELKIIIEGNYRNSAKQSIFIFRGPDLVNIIHPYWTPDKYFSGSVTLEFRRDYRYFIFCEAPQRYLDLKVSAGTDSVNNPSVQAILEWKHEFERHWGIELKGLIHRSPQWRAEGFWGSIYYRF